VIPHTSQPSSPTAPLVVVDPVSQGAEAAVLAEAYQACARITRDCARNFYYGLRLTPEPRRSAIYSVYAWMRRADDQVDSAADLPTKAARLGEFTTTALRMLAGEPLGPGEADPVWLAFRETVRHYRLDHADIRRLLKGLETDLTAEHEAANSVAPILICRTADDLREYCHCVASTVGLICVAIWGLRDDSLAAEARRLAIERGQAFQMTNILRDFAQDYDEGRVYLPVEDFDRAGLTPSELRDWSRPEVCMAFVQSQAAWARGRYQESAPLDAMIDPACRPALGAMTSIYSSLLTVIEKQPGRIVSGSRIRLPSAHKAGIALGALVRSLAARRFGRSA